MCWCAWPCTAPWHQPGQSHCGAATAAAGCCLQDQQPELQLRRHLSGSRHACDGVGLHIAPQFARSPQPGPWLFQQQMQARGSSTACREIDFSHPQPHSAYCPLTSVQATTYWHAYGWRGSCQPPGSLTYLIVLQTQCAQAAAATSRGPQQLGQHPCPNVTDLVVAEVQMLHAAVDLHTSHTFDSCSTKRQRGWCKPCINGT